MSDTTIKALEAGAGGTDLAAILFNQGGVNVKAAKSHLVDSNGNPIDFSALGIKGPGAAADAQRVHLSDEILALLGNISKVNGAAHGAGNPLFVDVTDRLARILGTAKAQQDGTWTVGLDAATLAALETISVGNFPATQAVNLTQLLGSPVSLANPVPIMPRANDLAVTAVGAAAAAVTLTLPAAGAGLYHYIDAIEITCYASAAGTGGATPVTVTSTNLPGPTAWTFPSGRAIGTNYNYVLTPNRPVRSAAANTATTIVCPATTGVIWRVNVFYMTGA